MVKQNKTRQRKRPAYKKVLPRNVEASQLTTRIPLFRPFELIVVGAFLLPTYILLAQTARTSGPINISSSQLYIIYGIFVVVNLWSIMVTIQAAKEFVSRARIWYFFGFSIHQLIVSSALAYWLLDHSQPGSFAIPSSSHGLSMIDAIYYAVTNFTTVSYSDITATSTFSNVIVLAQQVFSFMLVAIVLAIVITRSIQSYVRKGKPKPVAGSKPRPVVNRELAEANGYAALHPGDRTIPLTINLLWVYLIFSYQYHADVISPIEWALIAVGVCVPFYTIGRIIKASRDLTSEMARIKYLLFSAVSSLVYGYTYTYLLVSHAFPAFAQAGVAKGMTVLQALCFNIAALTTNGFDNIAPYNEFARVLICLQQLTIFLLFAVTLAFALSRWTPASQVQTVVVDVDGRAGWRRPFPDDVSSKRLNKLRSRFFK
jgi:hypothetical protein